MKKILIFMLAGVLSLGVMACGSSDTPDKVPVSADAETVENNDDSSVQEAEITVEEQLIYDANDVKVTVTGLGDSVWGPELKVLIENNGSQNVTVQSRNCNINDIMMEPMFSCDVAAGKKANDTITFVEEQLKNAGIEVIKDVELMIHLFDTDSWEDIDTSDMITITTTADPSYEQSYDTSGFQAVDRDGIKVIVKKLDSDDSFWGADVYLYIENNTERDIIVQSRDVSIDGFMVEPAFSCEVLAGKKAFSTLTFFEDDLEANNITDIQNLEVAFYVLDADSFDEVFITEPITINFE